MKDLLPGLYFAVALIAGNATADERILAFHSDIVVDADASMQVTETIRVRSEADKIRHGIYRDFPTDYRDRYGNRVHVDFDPTSLTRDGKDESFHSEAQSNGTRVYFGSKDVTLASGEYTYAFQYRTTRQLGFFADHDELYWNATGNGWDFPIDAASADVTLPAAIAQDDLHVEAYTGAQGAKGKAYTASVDAPSHAHFAATASLPPHNGLTLVVSFPKGQVVAPTNAARANWFMHDNGGVIIGAGGLLLVWIYYLVQWFRVGRDPKPGVIIPQYEAPSGFSPGALRHIEKMAYDDRCFTADIVDLAVHGKLRIEQAGKEYSLHRANGDTGEPIPTAETTLLDAALGSSDVLELKQENHTRIASARAAHNALLDKSNNNRYFKKNSSLVIPGVVLCIGALLLGMRSLAMGSMAPAAIFMLVWLSVWSIGVISLLGAAIKAWRTSTGIAGYGGALFLTLFSLPFVAGEIFGLGVFVAAVGVGFAVVVVGFVATNVAFFDWLKAPTLAGRELLDKIAGLRLYLGVAERDELAA
ncbi:MAG: DUF2207 domain-containing protein, partial [Dokdonella sp.]